MNTLTYKLCKNKVEKGMYQTQEEMQTMLDIFFAGERVTGAEYQELTELLKARHVEETA